MTVALEDEQARRLAATAAVEVRPGPAAGLWMLRAGNKVGALRVGDLELRITPKVPVARLLFLVGYARDPRFWRAEPITLDTADDLVPTLAAALWRQVDRALRPGLLQGYRSEDATSAVLRGRLREADQIRRRPGLAWPLEIRHDEYTVDIPENQILAAAITRMLRVPGIDDQSRRMLRHQSAMLATVTPPRPGQPVPAWQPSRLNARYTTAVRLAELVLAGTSLEAGTGSTVANGFLLDMPQVYEDFLSVALRQAIEPVHGGIVTLQHQSHLDEAGRIDLRPDIVWTTSGQVRAIIDAKYKAHTPATDAYQMLAYCTVHHLPDGHLVYPAADTTPTTHVVRGAGTRIHNHTLDLNQPPLALLAQIDTLANQITAG